MRHPARYGVTVALNENVRLTTFDELLAAGTNPAKNE